ncbi:MAG: dynamin family protein [Candidatus Marinimicrobia bacterium]|nr:dynamin family protein [Candidatus Neomarinimicrobiota bacterium]
MNRQNLAEQYKEKKERLLSLMDKMIKLDSIDKAESDGIIDKNQIDDIINDIKQEKFIISICGQIKSGKSTLLNNIIFEGRKILPVDDTVCTASLTRIKYNNRPYAKIYFYNSEEWNNLKNIQLDGNKNYFNEHFRKKLNTLAMKEGIQAKEIIKDERKTKEIKIDDLKNYISKEGDYTLFVKYVDIFINNKTIEDVQIVDTPGLNDYNIIRSQKTHDWIKRSTAVIMLFYAGQPISQNDFNFIDKYLSYIDSDKIIFVLNKIDTIDDYESVKNYIEVNIKKSEELRDRGLLGNDREVYPISSMAANLSLKSNQNIPFDNNDKFYLSKIDNSLINNDGRIHQLIVAINKYIMNNKGQAILEKGAQYIITTYEKLIKYKKKIRLRLEEEKKDKYKDIEQIDKKLNNINATMKNIKNIDNNFNDKINKETRKIKNGFSEILQHWIDEVNKDIKRWIKDQDIEEAIKLALRELKKQVKRKITYNIENFNTREIEGRIEDLVKEYQGKLKNESYNSLSAKYIKCLLPEVSINKLIEPIKNIDTGLNNYRSRLWGFLWTQKKKTKVNIKEKVDDELDKIQQRIENQLNLYINNHLINNLKGLSKELNDELSSYKKILEEFRNKKKKSVNIVDDYQAKIKEADNNIKYLKKKYNKAKKELSELNLN